MGELTSYAIDFTLKTRWDDLPEAVQHQAKRCFMDTLGAMVAGSQTPVAAIMRKTAREQFGGDQATIMVSGERVSAAGAALANGFFGNALDIDDGYRNIKGHPGACALPPLLAAAELSGGCSGQEFLTALVVAYELGIRAGVIRHATYEVYHSSGSWGAIAGAAAAGRLIKLTEEQLFHAMGAAEYHAPIAPMMKGIDTPAMGKDSIGWGCMVAMLSALMARDGFTGICPLFDDAPDAKRVEDLGHGWEILNLYFKPYAACRWGQPAVAGALKIVRENQLTPDRIRCIRVRTFEAATRLPNGHPRNTEEAQYSLAFSVAAALMDGEVGPAQVLPPRLYNPELLALLDRVSTEAAPEFEAEFPAKAPAEVIVETYSGETFRSGRIEAMWEPPDRLPSDSDLEAKFLWLTGPIIGELKANHLIEKIWSADQWTSIDPLINGCRSAVD
ncbi:MmgE/PrpD family protein [Desulfosarcina sp.]|uniref:MmgE/PrpD family protein n=1 Tax=Desulfosarcina sp. TaxID=2027861 RepID=UPI0029AB5617|nr:MmgE/PrpD family protein [Desulfosarcina sp.]MDX2453468.1 MmgE/PrpD family protein [Desulfosarcina sp.]MDX2491182.1 MmgE/PrpD family protein [Desulfosarcina sp.]